MPENENNAQQPTTGQKIVSGIGEIAKIPGVIPSVIGGLVMGGSALYQKLMNKIQEFSQNKIAQQDVLNKMVADGYTVSGQLPKWLKMPPGGVQGSGTEYSVNPKPTIWFNRKTGTPVLNIRATQDTRPEGQEKLPLHQGKKGGLGVEADINQEALNELNYKYYGGESGFNPRSELYPHIKNPGEEEYVHNENSGTGGYSQPEEANRNTYSPADPNKPNLAKEIPQGYKGSTQGTSGGSNEGGFWSGRRAFNEQIPLLTPQQQLYQERTINDLLRNPADFGAIRQNEIRRFKEETAPELAHQYFGRNPNSIGSAYPEALGRGGANLSQKLAAMQSQFEAEREGRRMNIATQPSFTTVRNPREPGFTEEFLKNILAKSGSSAVEGIGDWISNKFNQPTTSTQPQQPQQTQQTTQQPQVNASTYTEQQPQGKESLSQLSKSLSSPYTPRNDYENMLFEQFGHRLGGRSR